jgi:cyanophycinase
MNVSATFRFLAAVAVSFCLGAAPASTQYAVCAPNQGALVLVGGGANRAAFMDRFMQIAGGPNAKIVIIPTALDDQTLTPDRMDRLAHPNGMGGVTATVLHTRDPKVADSAAFVKPLLDATGVWILGGDESLLADAYAGTQTETAIKAILARGGVVGGTSAGAMIAGSVLVTAKASPLTVTGTRPAFDLLPSSYIVPHWSQRKLNFDLLAASYAKYPSRTAIGIDEATAAIVQGGTLEVVGDGRVGIYDGRDHNGAAYSLLPSGQSYDLATCATES